MKRVTILLAIIGLLAGVGSAALISIPARGFYKVKK